MEKKKPTIEELEEILNGDRKFDIRIMPNGEVRAIEKENSMRNMFKKFLWWGRTRKFS